MSLEVKCFDEKGAEAELAKCPQIVQDYVKKLKGSANNWKNICADAVNKLRNASKNNGVLHSVSQQRELLREFTDWYDSNQHYNYEPNHETVERFLSRNSG